jgi:hypothetical protein
MAVSTNRAEGAVGGALADDELGILRTLAEYCQRCDDGNFDDLLALFAPDAVLAYGDAQAIGLEELRAFFVERQGLVGRRGKHLTLNSVVDIEGNRAHALSDFLYLRMEDGVLTPVYTGRYRDDLVRGDVRWCFTRRQILRMDASKP